MSWRVATLAAVLTVAASGCCSALRTWKAGENDTALDTVRAIRYHMCASDWPSAARSLESGYAASRGGDPSQEAFWKTKQLISGEGVFGLVGPEDAIVGDSPPDASGRVRVEIRQADRKGKDRRPRYLLLEKVGGRWLIVGDDNN